jgi:hypothetical protein
VNQLKTTVEVLGIDYSNRVGNFNIPGLLQPQVGRRQP